MLAAGLIIFGLSAPVGKHEKACDRAKELKANYLKKYEGCAEQNRAGFNVIYDCVGGHNHDEKYIGPQDTTGMKYPDDKLQVNKIPGCTGKDDCPAVGVFEGAKFWINAIDERPPFAKPNWLTFDDYKGYCYVMEDSFDKTVSDSYANSRFNVTNEDWLSYPATEIVIHIPGVPDQVYQTAGYSGYIAYGCDDDEPTEEEQKFNYSGVYWWGLEKTQYPPTTEHKCKKGARSAYYKYDSGDEEYYRFEHSLTDFWGTVKHTIEERAGVRTYKVKVGLSNKLTVAAGIGIAVAVSAVIVAIGCVIFYCACKSKSAVKS